MRTHSDGKYSVTVTDASIDPVLVKVTIAGQASFTLEIPRAYYDGLALLELLEQHNAQKDELNKLGNTQTSGKGKERGPALPDKQSRRAA